MNIFDDLKYMSKPKNLKVLTEKYIQRLVENFFFSMFEYKNYPDSMPKELIERIFIYNGCIGSVKLSDADAEKYNHGLYKGSSVAAPAQPAEEPDFYGVGSKFILTSANGWMKVAEPEEVAIGWNNSSYSSLRIIIYNISRDIYNALSALRSGVNYSKNHPIYKSIDDKEKAALAALWDKVQLEDDQITITSNNIMEPLLGSEAAESRVINLTEPNLADKLQFLSKIVDDYMRWFCGLYGQTIQGNGKMAQQTKDEVNGQTSSSFILPNDMLYQRQLWNKKNIELGIVGPDAEIDFSKAWKVEEIKYQKEADVNENGETEELEQEPGEQPEEQPEEQSETEPETEPEEKEVKEDE